MSRRILFVFTSNDRLVNTTVKTGWYLPEAAHPYYGLKTAGFEINFVSELGGRPPLDESSISATKNDAVCQRFLNDAQVQKMLDEAPPLSSIKLPAPEYDAVFYPGGQGPLIGLPQNTQSQNLIRTMFEDGRVVSAICHAPAVFTEVKLQDGKYLVDGRKVTSMSNKEEELWGRVPYVPYLVQSRLKERGGIFIEGRTAWGDHVVVDKDSHGRKLVTGANPASGGSLAREIIKLLRE
ncbi:hypothetical protein MHUMG1_09496 [Metarhizium humberi]|uniref:D-lactate dehydratase n=1 Tax=Metarhizium humberi TaxID=2596975 RepID=A0A9P8M3C8_9HYPO|nr:hypothetical protein MHUMG1_09496 [Metarhizium humberi]